MYRLLFIFNVGQYDNQTIYMNIISIFFVCQVYFLTIFRHKINDLIPTTKREKNQISPAFFLLYLFHEFVSLFIMRVQETMRPFASRIFKIIFVKLFYNRVFMALSDL